MKNLSPDICLKIKSARREAGLSQSEVAAEVGCKQNALSMFEQGQPTKLNDEVVEKLAKKFGIELKEASTPRAIAAPLPALNVPSVPPRGFCPNPACPSNHGYLVEGRRLYLPNREEADPIGGKFCAMCGEVLERKCPNCGASVHTGAVCSLCGESYITSV